MRSALSSALLLSVAILSALHADAQSVSDELAGVTVPPPVVAIKPAPPVAPVGSTAPAPADPYAVSDVSADVKADTAAHARDQALLQAERAAFVQLCARMNLGDTAVKVNDDALAAMVQSFEVQSEHVSAVRYIGVFTIRFKPSAVRRRLGSGATPPPDANGVSASLTPPVAKAAPVLSTAHLPVAVDTDSLAAWSQIKRRLGNVPQISKIDVVSLGRGTSHVDLTYTGSIEDLQTSVTTQGFVLRNGDGGWALTDNSMVPR